MTDGMLVACLDHRCKKAASPHFGTCIRGHVPFSICLWLAQMHDINWLLYRFYTFSGINALKCRECLICDTNANAIMGRCVKSILNHHSLS